MSATALSTRSDAFLSNKLFAPLKDADCPEDRDVQGEELLKDDEQVEAIGDDPEKEDESPETLDLML